MKTVDESWRLEKAGDFKAHGFLYTIIIRRWYCRGLYCGDVLSAHAHYHVINAPTVQEAWDVCVEWCKSKPKRRGK